MQKLWITALLWLCALGSAVAQDVDVQKMVQDLERIDRVDHNLDLVLWMPKEYWEATLKSSGGLTPGKQKEFIDIIDKYVVFAVVSAKIGAMGSITATPRDELIGRVKVLADTQQLKPIADAALSAEMRTFLRVMKPVMVNMLGQFGEGIEFFVFNGKDAKGKRYADPRQQGMLKFSLAEKSFKWRLPLGCFMPAKFDSATGEEFPGNYDYSPYTGAKLVTTKSAGESK